MTVSNMIRAFNNGLKADKNLNPECRHCRECWRMGAETKIVRDAKVILDNLGRHHSGGWIQLDHDRRAIQELEKAALTLEGKGMLERRGVDKHVRFIEKPIYSINKKAS